MSFFQRRSRVSRKLFTSISDTIILAVLNKQSMHGYELLDYFGQNYGYIPSPGTVYPMLHKMEKQKLITPSKEPNSRRTIIYTITKEGKRSLAEHTKDFDYFSRHIRQLLGLDQE